MLKKLITLFFLSLIPLQLALSAELPEYSIKYDPSRDAFQDGRDAIKLAKLTNRRILIEVGGNWCSWCKKLDRFFNQHPKLKAKLHQTFVLLKVNVSDENKNSEFLKVFPKTFGYPHMFLTESNGKLFLSKDTAEFLVNHQYSVQRFEAFFKRWMINKSSSNV